MSAKSDWKRNAKKVTEGEWVKKIGLIADPNVQSKIASMVLWDFFGDSLNAPQGIKLMAAGYNDNVELTVEQVVSGLVTVGCPLEEAIVKANVSRQFIERAPIVDDNGNVHGKYLNSRNSTGDMAILSSICVLAVSDVKALVAAGVIYPDCTIRADWPPKDNNNGILGYTSKVEVKELIDFVMDGDLERLMVSMGINKYMEDVWDNMGLTGVPVLKAEPQKPIAMTPEVPAQEKVPDVAQVA